MNSRTLSEVLLKVLALFFLMSGLMSIGSLVTGALESWDVENLIGVMLGLLLLRFAARLSERLFPSPEPITSAPESSTLLHVALVVFGIYLCITPIHELVPTAVVAIFRPHLSDWNSLIYRGSYRRVRLITNACEILAGIAVLVAQRRLARAVNNVGHHPPSLQPPPEAPPEGG